MAPNLTSGTFKVVSLIDGRSPVGVNLTLPAWQAVHLNARATTWTVTEEGNNTYRLGVGGYSYTGLIDNKVTATVYEEQSLEWIATYREAQDAYTITLLDDETKAWTVIDPEDANSRITLKLLIEFRSLPPRFLTTQLFRFEEIDA